MLRVPFAAIVPGELALDPDTSRYVARVHRVRVGDYVLLFDPDKAIEAKAEIVAVERQTVRCRVGELVPARIVAERRITLVQGLAKGDKIDAIVRDATELGVTGIVIVEMARSTARIAPGDASARRDRWRRIAVEAARQSGRGDAPEIVGPVSWDQAFVGLQAALRICLWERATSPLGRLLVAASKGTDVAVIVGPEGGLDDDEVVRATAHGFVAVSLGPVILRTETVAAAVLGALLVIEPTRGGG